MITIIKAFCKCVQMDQVPRSKSDVFIEALHCMMYSKFTKVQNDSFLETVACG